MSIDPGFIRPGTDAAPPPNSTPGVDLAAHAQDHQIGMVELLRLQDGDRIIVHVDGAAGMSAGGAHEIGQQIRTRLKLGDLPYDVPVLVVSPGIHVTVARTT